MSIDKAEHTTHEHLLSIINTELGRFSEYRTLRILDVGCGDGKLIGYLMNNLPKLNDSIDWEIHGFDVHDHGVQKDGFINKSIGVLSDRHPNVPWSERIKSIAVGETWPYGDDTFHIIISNQVIEHVNDHDQFFSEVRRTMREDGYSIHLFPLKENIFEGHVWLPWAHRIYNYDLLKAYIKAFSKLGIGKFPPHNRMIGIGVDDYAEKHADYMTYYANFISYREVLMLAKRHKMRASYRYTREFYTRKLRAILSMKRYYLYSDKRSAFREWLDIMLLKYACGITLLMEKKETYRNYENPL